METEIRNKRAEVESLSKDIVELEVEKAKLNKEF